MNPSTRLARAVVAALAAGGVSEVVLAPGSRNAPLSMALHDADAAGRLRLHVRIDERTAGFLALGLARGAGRPAVVVTTSGTAVANLHPAVLEAHHGGVPLLVLSADRPPALRGVGANQTIDQHTVFGSALRMFHEFDGPDPGPGGVVARALGAVVGASGWPGPAQLNLPFAEPLLPGPARDVAPATSGALGPILAGALRRPLRPPIPPTEPGERVLVVADLTHPRAAAVAAAGHLVVAEAGGAAGAEVLATGLHLLACPSFVAAARPDRVVVLGRPTLSRAVAALLADPAVTVDRVTHPEQYDDPSTVARAVSDTWPDLTALPDPAWAESWRAADRAAAAVVRGHLQDRGLDHSPRLAADLVRALPTGATLVLGSSQPPRDVGAAAAPRAGLRLVANRGVAGIDGMVSTAVGVALADPRRSTVALLGDLTFLHDVTGLVIGPREPVPDLVIVVSNNDGGGVFGTLEPGAPAHAHAFERVFGTPHGVDLAGLAAATGVEHRRASTADELATALVRPRGIRLVEVITRRSDLRAAQRELARAVQRAIAPTG